MYNIEDLANELRNSLIGDSKSSATISKVCDKILNDNAYRNQMIKSLENVKQKLHTCAAAQKVTEIISEMHYWNVV